MGVYESGKFAHFLKFGNKVSFAKTKLVNDGVDKSLRNF